MQQTLRKILFYSVVHSLNYSYGRQYVEHYCIVLSPLAYSLIHGVLMCVLLQGHGVLMCVLLQGHGVLKCVLLQGHGALMCVLLQGHGV